METIGALRHSHKIKIIKSTYQGKNCSGFHEGCLSETFKVLTGVWQGCLLSPFLLLLCIDWAMTQVTSINRTGIWWSLTEQLEDLDFSDDQALLAHTHQQMQDESCQLEKVNATKTK